MNRCSQRDPYKNQSGVFFHRKERTHQQAFVDSMGNLLSIHMLLLEGQASP